MRKLARDLRAAGGLRTVLSITALSVRLTWDSCSSSSSFRTRSDPRDTVTLSTSTMERAHDEVMDGEPALAERPQRRRFTAAYKLAIVAKHDACTGNGDKGALLRSEGLYSSHVTEWRRARDAGALGGLNTKPRKDRPVPQLAELARATRRAERAEAKLAKAQQVIEIQGRFPVLLEQLLAESTTEHKQSRS